MGQAIYWMLILSTHNLLENLTYKLLPPSWYRNCLRKALSLCTGLLGPITYTPLPFGAGVLLRMPSLMA